MSHIPKVAVSSSWVACDPGLHRTPGFMRCSELSRDDATVAGSSGARISLG